MSSVVRKEKEMLETADGMECAIFILKVHQIPSVDAIEKNLCVQPRDMRAFIIIYMYSQLTNLGVGI